MPHTLTRRELYDRAWAVPIDRLAAELGMSNVGLGKACRRHDIPVPPRGYWRRKETGHVVEQPPLPGNGEQRVTLYGERRTPASPDEGVGGDEDPLVAYERQPENAIAVPEQLRPNHPLLAATRAYWAAQKRGEIRYGANTLPYLNVRVSEAARPRAFRILQALFSALERRGHSVAATVEGRTKVTVLGETFSLVLRERSKQVLHVPTEKERADAKKYSWMRPPPYDLVSSGVLELDIENVWGTRHTWRDGKRQRLEGALNEVIVGLLEAAYAEKARAEARRLQELAEEEAERRRAAARQQWRLERARVRRLERLRAVAEDHERLRSFVADLRHAASAAEPTGEIERWLEWADRYVDRTDPWKAIRAPRDTIRLYHATSRYDADEILRNGFSDRDSPSGDDADAPAAVTLTDAPVERGYHAAVLVVDIPERAVLPYEWITETRSHRRFDVPAAVVNQHGRVGAATA